MNKPELADLFSKESNITQEKSDALIDAISEQIIDEISKGSFVYLDGLGIFWTKTELERRGQNPRNSEEIVLPEIRVPSFTSGPPSEYAKRAAVKILTSKDIAKNISASTGDDQVEASRLVDSYVDCLKTTLQSGERILIVGFGTFESMKFPSRSLTDPDTGEIFSTEAEWIYRYSAAKVVRERLEYGLLR
jgi:DNA-binding protein HU-beta